jgi:hypothetical protein
MNMTILIACAIGSTAPCIGLWLADERARRRSRPA